MTRFCLDNDEIAPADEFEFEAFPEFISYLEDEGFSYLTRSEKLLNQLKEANEKEGYALEDVLEQVEGGLVEAKKKAIQEKQPELENLIEKEIASRYYYQIGKVRMSLKNDQEIKDAIRILNDQSEYQRILAGQ